MNLQNIDLVLTTYQLLNSQLERDNFLEDFLQSIEQLSTKDRLELQLNVYVNSLEQIARSNRILKTWEPFSKNRKKGN